MQKLHNNLLFLIYKMFKIVFEPNKKFRVAAQNYGLFFNYFFFIQNDFVFWFRNQGLISTP